MRLRDLPPAMQAEARAKLAALAPPKAKGAARVAPMRAPAVREPSSFPITVWLPLGPNLGNARMHWRTELAAKKAYKAELTTRASAGFIAPPPAEPAPHTVAAVDVWLSRAPRINDKDNAHRRLKWAWDWLKGARYIADDDEAHLTYTLDQHRGRCDDAPPLCSIRIVLSPLAVCAGDPDPSEATR